MSRYDMSAWVRITFCAGVPRDILDRFPVAVPRHLYVKGCRVDYVLLDDGAGPRVSMWRDEPELRVRWPGSEEWATASHRLLMRRFAELDGQPV